MTEPVTDPQGPNSMSGAEAAKEEIAAHEGNDVEEKYGPERTQEGNAKPATEEKSEFAYLPNTDSVDKEEDSDPFGYITQRPVEVKGLFEGEE